MKNDMVLAMQQPNFFPWLGLFDRLSMVNTFVFFDHVQMPRGKTCVSRNKILLNGVPRWLTIPTIKDGKQKISDVKINYSSNFERKHLGTIKQAYGKCKYFEEVFFVIENLYKKRYKFLADFNKEFITTVSNNIGLSVSFISSSDLLKKGPYLRDLTGNDLVLGICFFLKTGEYMSGKGCIDFIDPPTFVEKNIIFNFHKFVHPEYKQVGNIDFVPYLSSIDVLFNIGFVGMGEIIK